MDNPPPPPSNKEKKKLHHDFCFHLDMDLKHEAHIINLHVNFLIIPHFTTSSTIPDYDFIKPL